MSPSDLRATVDLKLLLTMASRPLSPPPPLESLSEESGPSSFEKSTNDADENLVISVAEAMNPSRRPNMEDAVVFHRSGEWDGPPGTSYLAIYDGHGGM